MKLRLQPFKGYLGSSGIAHSPILKLRPSSLRVRPVNERTGRRISRGAAEPRNRGGEKVLEVKIGLKFEPLCNPATEALQTQ